MVKLLKSAKYLKNKGAREQIAIGQELNSRRVNNTNELVKLQADVSLWDQQNGLLIKASFDDDDEYKMYMGRVYVSGHRSDQEKLTELKEDIEKYLGNIRAIETSLDHFASSPPQKTIG